MVVFSEEDVSQPIDRLAQLLRVPSSRGVNEVASVVATWGEQDWQACLALAASQGVVPLLYAQLQHGGLAGVVPRAMLDLLQQASYHGLGRNLRMQHNLVLILKALRDVNVPVVVLKGGALLHTVYDSLAVRQLADVDVLVRESHVETAMGVLADLGYRMEDDHQGMPVRFVRLYGGHLGFSRRGSTIELHWRLLVMWWLWEILRMDMDAIWDRAQPLEVDGVQAWQLSPEDNLLHLCFHMAAHVYGGLKWYVDVDRAIRYYGGSLDWDVVVDRARSWGVDGMVYPALWYSRELLDTPMPAVALQALELDWWRKRLILPHLAPRRAFDRGMDSFSGRFRRNLWMAGLLEGPSAWVRVLWRGLFPGREWLRLRYDLSTRWQVLLFTLWYPFVLLRQFIISMRGRSSSAVKETA